MYVPMNGPDGRFDGDPGFFMIDRLRDAFDDVVTGCEASVGEKTAHN